MTVPVSAAWHGLIQAVEPLCCSRLKVKLRLLSEDSTLFILSGNTQCVSSRDVREFANGSVCVECDGQCERRDGNALTCLGQVRLSLHHLICLCSASCRIQRVEMFVNASVFQL